MSETLHPSVDTDGIPPENGKGTSESEQFRTESELARDAFGEHVARVADMGDAFYTDRKLDIGRFNTTVAGVTAPIGAMIGGGLGVWCAGAAIAAGGTAALHKRAQRRHDARDKPSRLDRETQELLGERYELMRMKVETDAGKKEAGVVLRYYGPLPEGGQTMMDADEYVGHVYKMAELARQYGVDVMTVDNQVCNELFKFFPKTSTTQKLLGSRGIHVSGILENDTFVPGPPKAWLELSAKRRLAAAVSDGDEETAELVEKLRSVAGEHPLVRVYDQVAPAGDPELLRKSLTRVARDGIARDFSRIEISKLRGFEDPFNPDSFDVVSTRQLWMADLVEEGTTVRWSHQGDEMARALAADVLSIGDAQMTEAAALDRGLSAKDARMGANSTAAQIRELALNPGKDSKLAAQLLPLLIAQKMHMTEEQRRKFRTLPLQLEVTNDQEQHRMSLFDGEALQEMSKLPGSMQPHRRRQLGRAMLMGLVAGAIGWSGGYQANHHYDDALTAARAHIAATRHVDVNTIDLRDSSVRALVASQSSEDRIWGYVDTANQWLRLTMPGTNKNNDNLGGPPYTNAVDMGVGNVDSTAPIRVDWKLTAIGDADLGGYWEEAASSHLSASRPDSTIQWLPDSNALQTLPLPQNANVPYGIDVQRELQPDDTAAPKLSNNDIEIPVQAGEAPVAASLNGEPLEVDRLAEGLFALHSNKTIEGGKLEYVITPSSEGAHATIRNDIELDGAGGLSAEAVSNIQQVFTQYIPGYSGSLSQAERIKLVETYIDQHFDYRLRPLGSDLSGYGPARLISFVQEVLKGEKANCNVASTLIALAATDVQWIPSDDTIGVVSGYLNQDTGLGLATLTSNEAHQFNDNEKGDLIDYTPSRGITQADKAYLDGHPQPPAAEIRQPQPKPLLPLGLEFLALGGAAMGLRRFERHFRRAGGWRHTRRVMEENRHTRRENTAESLGVRAWEAAEVLNAILYDPKVYDPKHMERGRLLDAQARGQERAAQAAKNPTVVSGASIVTAGARATLLFLARNTFNENGEVVSDRVRSLINNPTVSKEDKRAARRALRTLRTFLGNTNTTDFSTYLPMPTEPATKY